MPTLKERKESFVTISDLRLGYRLKPKQLLLLGEPCRLARSGYGGSSVKLYGRERVRCWLAENGLGDLDAAFDVWFNGKEAREMEAEAKKQQRFVEAESRRKERDSDSWSKWNAHHDSSVLAAAEALVILNRWAKSDGDVKYDIYGLKDRWIAQHQDYLTIGLRARLEIDDFTGCSRTLWVHHFEIEGRAYCFHSYTQPSIVSDGKSDDLPFYGRLLSRDEIRSFPLPLPDILGALRHYFSV